MRGNCPHLDTPHDKSLNTNKLPRLYSESTKRDIELRLNRIEGQIRGIKGLIGRDTYCDDVIEQIASAQSPLNGVAKILLAAPNDKKMAPRRHCLFTYRNGGLWIIYTVTVQPDSISPHNETVNH
ncbi:metal-sensing transcriptional repressor [Neobacillus sp. SAB-20_R2A]|uniref:metal-sensing transcriptional repressor n=1 Tax=Neobacillus sp. SAB-20_R2A TaxID=3120519 RepID=UPI003C6E912B